MQNGNKEANRVAEMIADGLEVDSREAGKMLSSVVEQSITDDGGIMNIANTIVALEGNNKSFRNYQELFDTAKAVMHMAQGKTTEVDNALISRSSGAVTLLTAVEGNNKALKSIKTAAQSQLRESATEVQNDATTMHNVEGIMQNEDVSPTRSKVSEINKSLSDADIYSYGEKISIPEDAKMSDGIVISEASEKFRKSNHEGYNAIKKFAKSTNTPVIFVDELQGFDKDGNVQNLDGIEFEEGIVINLQSEDPIMFTATHEFGHRLKRLAPESWAKYQKYAIEQKRANGSYEEAYKQKEKHYKENKIEEEIASNYIREVFSDQDNLVSFIKKDRGFAVKVRDMWYSVLDYFGRLDEKKKAQQL